MLIENVLKSGKHAEYSLSLFRYAYDAEAFRVEFAAAFDKLLAFGFVAQLQFGALSPPLSEPEGSNRRFRHLAMHSFVPPAREMLKGAAGSSGEAADVDLHVADPSLRDAAARGRSSWSAKVPTHRRVITLELRRTRYPRYWGGDAGSIL